MWFSGSVLNLLMLTTDFLSFDMQGDEGALNECLVEAEAELEAEAQMEAKNNIKDMHQYLEQHKVDFSQKK